ncbi:MAG: HupE/UreJ family protein [Bacteroidetes bacterium]|nr:HupE/UreJ family protein [Bacteroidota bacterium]
MRKFLFIGFLFFPATLWAHGFGGSGFLHPLTGIDHIIAMVAVGAWSAQLGGKAIYRVPASFLAMMCLGGVVGIQKIPVAYTELSIALSVLLLGLAIAINKKIAWLIAAVAVGLFGFYHGYSHGAEIPNQHKVAEYIVGFLLTTLGLHIAGAVAGLLLLEEKNGEAILRIAGGLGAATGVFLFLKLLI